MRLRKLTPGISATSALPRWNSRDATVSRRRERAGKTNLLEAAGFLTALRSFRATNNKLLIGHGQPRGDACDLEPSVRAKPQVTIKLHPDSKDCGANSARHRGSRIISENFRRSFLIADLQLVRGSPAARRRWLDRSRWRRWTSTPARPPVFTAPWPSANALLKRGVVGTRNSRLRADLASGGGRAHGPPHRRRGRRSVRR